MEEDGLMCLGKLPQSLNNRQNHREEEEICCNLIYEFPAYAGICFWYQQNGELNDELKIQRMLASPLKVRRISFLLHNEKKIRNFFALIKWKKEGCAQSIA